MHNLNYDLKQACSFRTRFIFKKKQFKIQGRLFIECVFNTNNVEHDVREYQRLVRVYFRLELARQPFQSAQCKQW
jgi:hypothetical protein